MKYLYTLFALFITISLSAQTSPITFDEAWTVGGDDWTIKADEGTSDVSIVDDPTATNGKVLKVQYNDTAVDGVNQWQNAQIKLTAGQNLIEIGPGKTITLDVWTDHTGDPNIGTYTGMIKLEMGTIPTNKEFSFPVSGTGWETVTIDTSVDKAGNAVEALEAGLMVLFTAYGNGAEKTVDLRYYDNITFSDGTAISSDAEPATAAPTPTHAEADVLNIFSDNYSGGLVWSENEIRAGWSHGSSDVYDLGGDKMVKNKANFVGHYWNTSGSNVFGAVDFSGHTNINLDVWVPEISEDKVLGVALLAAGEVLKNYTITAGAAGWRTLTIPVSDFADSGTAVNAVNGVKLEQVPHGSIPLYYWDNLFAWSAPSNNTVATFSVDANNAGAIFDAAGGEVLAISYSTDGGNNYTLSNPLTDGDGDGIWTGDVTFTKDGSTVQYKLVTTDGISGYTTANDSSGDSLASDADFSFLANANTIAPELVFLDRDTGSSFATTKASAKVDVTIQVDGFYPGQTYGQYGIIPPDGTAVYALGAVNDAGNGTDGDGILQGVVAVPFYSTFSYDLHFNNDALEGASWDNLAHPTKDATTNASFSVTVVEDDVIEYLSPITAEDANGNFVTYSASLSINDINVELTIYPNPADQFISVKSSEVLSGIRVIDMTGKEVIRKSVQSNDYSLDLGNLNTGIYFLEATSEGASKTMRFIKK